MLGMNVIRKIIDNAIKAAITFFVEETRIKRLSRFIELYIGLVFYFLYHIFVKMCFQIYN